LNTGNTTYAGGGSYVWEVNSASGPAGTDSGYDLQNIAGALNITAASGDEFTVKVTSLKADNTRRRRHQLRQDQQLHVGPGDRQRRHLRFNASDFTIDTSAFTNDITGPVSNGSFALQVNGKDLDLIYTGAAVPEPASPRRAIARWSRPAGPSPSSGRHRTVDNGQQAFGRDPGWLMNAYGPRSRRLI
jgi:hypothetical protein